MRIFKKKFEYAFGMKIFETIRHSLIVFLVIHVLDVNCIEGGVRARVGQFKYVVSMRYREEHFCTGSIIHKSYILTAKHCMFVWPLEHIYVYAGMVDMEDPNVKVLTIAAVYIYPAREVKVTERKTIQPYYKHDIAILKLNQGLVWTATLAPISVIEREHVWDFCEVCIVPGWNFESYDKIPELFLLFLHGYAITDRDCYNRIGFTHPNHKCIFDANGQGITSPGDSGTPFICNDALVGIFMGGFAEKQYPSVLVDVSPYLQFISEIMNDGKVKFKLEEFPYIVSIWNGDAFVCGGTIIDKIQILTAGHCVRGISSKDLKIAAGRTQISPRDPTIKWLYIDSIEFRVPSIHKFDGTLELEYTRNDIAVIKLATSLPSNPNIGSAPLPPPDGMENFLWKHCRVFRWIREFDHNVGVSRNLVWFSGTLLPQDFCRKEGVALEVNQFCSTSPFGYPLSDHDAGGTPFVCGGIMNGILISPRSTPATVLRDAIFIRIPKNFLSDLYNN